MAIVNQEEEAAPNLRPIVSQLPSIEARNRSTEPFAQLIHRGLFALDAPGSGNTLRLRLAFNLPQNYGYILQHLVVVFATVDTWNFGVLENYLADSPATPGPLTTQIDVPIARSTFGPDGSSDSGSWIAGANDIVQPPWILYGYPSNSTFPTFVIGNGTEDTAQGPIVRYYASWLAFTLEQINNAPLLWPARTLTVR